MKVPDHFYADISKITFLHNFQRNGLDFEIRVEGNVNREMFTSDKPLMVIPDTHVALLVPKKSVETLLHKMKVI